MLLEKVKRLQAPVVEANSQEEKLQNVPKKALDATESAHTPPHPRKSDQNHRKNDETVNLALPMAHSSQLGHHYNPLKTHEEDIVEVYDLYCTTRLSTYSHQGQETMSAHALYSESPIQVSKHITGGNNATEQPRQQQFEYRDGSSSSNQMQLPAFLWFLRDAGLTLPSPEPASTSQSSPMSAPQLTYAAAARLFEEHAQRHRIVRSILVCFDAQCVCNFRTQIWPSRTHRCI